MAEEAEIYITDEHGDRWYHRAAKERLTRSNAQMIAAIAALPTYFCTLRLLQWLGAKDTNDWETAACLGVLGAIVIWICSAFEERGKSREVMRQINNALSYRERDRREAQSHIAQKPQTEAQQPHGHRHDEGTI